MPEEVAEKPKKKRNGAYARRKGNNYELKIIKELTETRICWTKIS